MANEIIEITKTLMAIRLFGLDISGCRNIVKSFQEKASITSKITKTIGSISRPQY